MKDTFVNRLLAFILSAALVASGRITYLAFRYLSDPNVVQQVAPVSQEPIVVGNFTCLEHTEVNCLLWKDTATGKYYDSESRELGQLWITFRACV